MLSPPTIGTSSGSDQKSVAHARKEFLRSFFVLGLAAMDLTKLDIQTDMDLHGYYLMGL